ncbi:MAG: hypothetical protein EOO04_36330, partial [Chitinophagaceae bacterium]
MKAQSISNPLRISTAAGAFDRTKSTTETDTAETSFRNPLNIAVLIGTFLLMIGSGYIVYELQDEFTQFNRDRMSTTWGMVFLVIASGLLLFKVAFFIY